jgi:hypothetical protein
LPPRLLVSIGRVESGRRDPDTGAFGPWPWTINAEGRGSFYPDKSAAIAAVRALQAQGVRSIDVGCMQVNLRHHPNAFASLEDAFDPLTNARYAARFLGDLRAGPAGGDWMQAAGFYHSQTPNLADGYRARVVAAMGSEQGGAVPPASLLASAGAAAAYPAGPGAIGLSNRSEAVAIRPAGMGGQGRGLDAYRAMPIPVTGRIMVAAATTTLPTVRPVPLASAMATPASSAAAPAQAAGQPAPRMPGAPVPLLPAIGGRGPLFPGLPGPS